MRSQTSSTHGDPNRPYAFYATRRLHLAAFVKAANLLEFSHTEKSVDGKAVFIFHDERREGELFEKSYEHGGLVAARSLFAAQLFLRKEIEAITKTGAHHYDQPTQRS